MKCIMPSSTVMPVMRKVRTEEFQGEREAFRNIHAPSCLLLVDNHEEQMKELNKGAINKACS